MDSTQSAAGVLATPRSAPEADVVEVRGADPVDVRSADAVDVRGADGVEARGTEGMEASVVGSVNVHGTDAAKVRGTETVEIYGPDAADVRGAASVDVRGADAARAQIRGTDSVDIRGADSSDVRGVDGLDVRGADGGNVRGAETADLRSAETVDLRGAVSVDVHGMDGHSADTVNVHGVGAVGVRGVDGVQGARGADTATAAPAAPAAVTSTAITTGGVARRRGGWDPLDDLAVRVGSTLDPVITAQEVADLVVPGLADHVSILLRESMLSGTGAAEPRDGPIRLVRLAISAWDADLAEQLRNAWPVGQVIVVPEAAPHSRAMRSHETIIEPVRQLPPTVDEIDVIELPEDRPAVFASLLVGGRVLGVMVFTRDPERGPFRPAEITSIERVAARASIWMDNARLHDQLRHMAISMQTAMLPTKLATPAGLEIAHRYLPGSDMAVVGGDWFDVIELSGGRVALVVGDVMGHGTQAASAMGQMRTAVRTLAAVDLPPAEVLAHLDDLMPDIDDSLFATCVYAVYDPATQQCSISRAGHVPPVVVHPDGRTEVLHQVAPGLPLGLGGAMGTFDTLDIELADGALFVLCTDGLLENKARDIDTGLNLLRANLAGPGRPLQEICDQVVKELDLTQDRDDIALLIARVRPLPPDRSATWWLPGEPRQVAHCRRLVRDTLAAWELSPLTETVELLVSELVTNAIQHAGGEIRLRLQRDESGLLCEVCDQTRTPPELQELSATAERGRGILLVNELSRKWGHRRTASGKIVWFTLEQP